MLGSQRRKYSEEECACSPTWLQEFAAAADKFVELCDHAFGCVVWKHDERNCPEFEAGGDSWVWVSIEILDFDVIVDDCDLPARNAVPIITTVSRSGLKSWKSAILLARRKLVKAGRLRTLRKGRRTFYERTCDGRVRNVHMKYM